MKTLIFAIGIISMLFSFSKAEVKEGDYIPPLKAVDDTGREINLNDFKGKWIVLYFYPKDNTPGCTKEAITYSKLKEEFERENAVVFGINTDTVESHRKFKEKHNISIPLISDDGKIAKLFGVKMIFGICFRDTVIINPEGKVEKIYRGVDPEGNPVEVLKYIREKNKTG